MKDYIINSFIMTSNIDFVTIAGTKLVEGHIDTLNYEGINPHCELLKHHTSHLTGRTVTPPARMRKVHCSKVSTVLQDYAGRATIHGVGYLGDPR